MISDSYTGLFADKLISTVLSIALFATAVSQSSKASTANGGPMFQLTSRAFQAEGNIPKQFTCEGRDISPELTWQNPPSGTRTLALIVHDPDAPRAGGFTHWIVYNIPASATKIAENAPRQQELADGSAQGRNDFGKIGYGGPCPPSGTHRYFFRLYALDAALQLRAGATQNEVEEAIEGHILGQTELMGKYTKSSTKAA